MFNVRRNYTGPILACTALLFACEQHTDDAPKSDVVTPLTNDQIVMLWEKAASQELIGDPVITVFEDTVSGGQITRKLTAQRFKITFYVDDKNVPTDPPKGDSEVRAMARGIRTGFGLTSCSSTCSSLIVGQTCSVTGCDPKGASCTAPSCPAN